MADSNVPPVSNEEALKLCKPQDSGTKDFIMQQTMYRIKDPKRSIPFYTEVLGMQLLTKLDFPTMKFSLYFMGYEDPNDNALQNELSSKERIAWVMGRKATIELTHNWGTENDDNYKSHNGNTEPKGFGHIGLVVPDVYKACERFEKLGVNFVKKPEDDKMKGIAFITDPDGYWIEILNNIHCSSRKSMKRGETKAGAGSLPGTSQSQGPRQETGEDLSEEAKKRKRSLSDPSLEPKLKRTRQGPSPAKQSKSVFSAVSANLPRVMVIFGEVLGERMLMEAYDHLKGKVLDLILDGSEEFTPRFRDTFLRDGVATFICEDEGTEKWLREAVPSIRLEDGTQARIVLPEELIKRVRVTVLIPPPKREATQLIQLLGRQNPELKTDKWKILQSVERGLSTLLFLGVDEESAKLIKAKRGKVFLGMQQVEVRLAKDPERGKIAKGNKCGGT